MRIIDYLKKKIIKKKKIFFIKTSYTKLIKNNYPFTLNFEILEDNYKNYLSKPNKIPNISYPKIDNLLKKIFKKNKKIGFLDIGAQFIDNYLYLFNKNKNLKYFYFDQKINNKIVEKFAKFKKFKNFTSIIKIENIKKHKIDFVYFGSVIQYINNYNKIIKIISKKKPKFIFFSGTNTYQNYKKDYFVVKQVNVWPQTNYCYFFKNEYLVNNLKKYNYRLVFKKNNINDRKINYSNLSKPLDTKINYTDLFFEYKN